MTEKEKLDRRISDIADIISDKDAFADKDAVSAGRICSGPGLLGQSDGTPVRISMARPIVTRAVDSNKSPS
jgi:hypothetical protein